MIKHLTLLASVSLLGALAFASPSAALSMKECSAKYKTAQADGSAKDIKWNDFRKAQCGPDATAEPEVTMATGEEPEKPTTAAPKGVTFPTAIAPKYAKETPGKARMHTCVDMYKANKASNANGGLKWIQKGGGYYSECTKKLKGGTV